MARFFIRDTSFECTRIAIEVHRVEDFGHIAEARTERACPVAPALVLGEERRILFQRTPAPGGVDHVDVGTAAFEGFDIAFGEVASELIVARMDGDRAAASLRFWHDNVHSSAAQHANRRLVYVRKSDLHHATRMKKCRSFGARRVVALIVCDKEVIRNYRRELRRVAETEDCGE